jgi:hypothetical protein
MGRLKARAVGWHSEDKMHLPTKELPWATPMLPTNNINVYSPREGDMVVGFFTDGENAQEPVIMGVLPGIALKAANAQDAFCDPRTATELASAPKTPDSKEYNTDGSGIVITEKGQADSYPKLLDEPTTSRIARNDPESITETFIQERKDNLVTGVETVSDSWDEPETLYNTVYPYNNVVETESGHLLEFDDTPEAERIHLAHRNGSFQEWFPNGDKVEKVTKDNYQIIMGDDKVYIMGKCQVTIQGDAELYVQGNFDMNVDGTCNIRSTGNMKLNAPLIDLNDGTNGAARIGDTADTGDQGTGGHFDTNSAGTNVIETGSGTVVIGG